MNKKGIIKVGGKSLNKNEIAKVAMIAPKSTMNMISNYKVKEKIKLEIPDEVVGVAKCINPNCITNNEKVKTIFFVEQRKPFKFRCAYCEKTMSRDDIEIL
jgi:aspartate carbamoyltransferase regulatory subunit